jgi:phosphatidate cytidylyltransferase
MSDDAWRRDRRDRANDDDFGPPLFGDETPTDRNDALSFGASDTGPLPHWTSPPTGEMPAVLGGGQPSDHTDDLDVWSSFSESAPVWSDDPLPTDEFELPGRTTGPIDRVPSDLYDDDLDESAPVQRRGQGRITIGTDPTDDRMGRPMPATRGRGRGDAKGGARTSTRPVAAPPKSGRDMPTAIAVGLLLVAAFIGALLVGPWAVMIVVVLIIGLAAVEFFDKVSEKGYRPATVAGVVAVAAFPLAAYWAGEQALPLVLLLAFTAGCVTFIAAPSLESSPLPNMAVTTLGVVWIGFTGSFAALIVSFSNLTLVNSAGSTTSVGTDTLFLLALGVVANDIGALFIGSAAGRTPLRQWISPNKTVEGFLGGAVMTLLAMVVVGVADKSTTWNSTGDLLILGAVISLAAPIGDLTESMFKRNLDIKDFGSLVKGHGGVLDRFDGFLFTLPAVYYLMQILEPWLTK